MIVSDAGPIIIFARIGHLSLLHKVTGSLIIPAAVHDEILVNKGGMLGAGSRVPRGFSGRSSLTVRLSIGCRSVCTLANAKRSRWRWSMERSC